MELQYYDTKVETICPICLKKIDGIKYQKDNNIYLKKECPEHGIFNILIYDDVNHYIQMESSFNVNRKKPKKFVTDFKYGCPYDCGLCSNHTQDTCLAIIEVTNKCNLMCKYCFSNANVNNNNNEPSLKEIELMFDTVLKCQNPPTCIQISGGEPTLREDLPDIIKLARSMGIDHIELNTNGIRIASDINYFKKIVEAGIDAIYMSFDSISDSVYLKRCNTKLFEIKNKVIDLCRQFNIGVVLVPLVAKDYNLHCVGEIINFAKENVPVVRGVHFQPIFTSGRSDSTDNKYVTIFELIKEIECQTNGELKIENFTPSLMPNPHCGATCLSLVDKNKLVPLTNIFNFVNSNKIETDVASRTKKSVINRWKNKTEEDLKQNSLDIPVINSCCNTNIKINPTKMNQGWIDFVKQNETSSLTISIMAFQDSSMYEIGRTKNCCIHVVTTDGKMIPFCNYNLSSSNQKDYLYRFK